MNRVIERIWHETNQRVVYPLKEMLVEFEMSSLFNMDDPIQKWTVGYVVRGLVGVGTRRFVASWNNHRIPGPSRGIPSAWAQANNRITPIDDIMTSETLVEEYRAAGGSINDLMGVVDPVDDMSELYSRLTLIEDHDSKFEAMLAGDKVAVYNYIRAIHEYVINATVV